MGPELLAVEEPPDLAALSHYVAWLSSAWTLGLV